MTRVGMLTIGQAPRPDLVEPFGRLRPDVELVQAGALDDLTSATMPVAPGNDYPLTTRLRDGSPVTLDESALLPLLRSALARLEASDVDATLLLCAGPFEALRGTRPLIKPFDVTARVLHASGARRIGVVVPLDEQRRPAVRAFAGAGFSTTAWAASLEVVGERAETWLADAAVLGRPIDHLVLDYVGHDPDEVASAQRRVPVPLLDLGLLAAEIAASVV